LDVGDQILVNNNQILVEEDQILVNNNQILVNNNQILVEGDQILVNNNQILAEGDQILAEDNGPRTNLGEPLLTIPSRPACSPRFDRRPDSTRARTPECPRSRRPHS